MTREEMRRVLGEGTDDFQLEILEGLGTTEIDVVHERPLLVGPTELTKDNRGELREAFYASGTRGRFTGYQMAGHIRDVGIHLRDKRFYYAPTGGETMVSITARGRTFDGFAKCSEEDVFCRTVGRRLAFTRALLEATWAEFTSPRCQEHSTAGERPKPRLGTGKSSPSIREFAERIGKLGEPSSPIGKLLADLRLSPGGAWSGSLSTPPRGPGSLHFSRAFLAEVLPPHIVLQASALRKLRDAEKLDAGSEVSSSKQERKAMRRRARILREQAMADAAVACELRPDPEDEVKPTVAARNEG